MMSMREATIEAQDGSTVRVAVWFARRRFGGRVVCRWAYGWLYYKMKTWEDLWNGLVHAKFHKVHGHCPGAAGKIKPADRVKLREILVVYSDDLHLMLDGWMFKHLSENGYVTVNVKGSLESRCISPWWCMSDGACSGQSKCREWW